MGTKRYLADFSSRRSLFLPRYMTMLRIDEDRLWVLVLCGRGNMPRAMDMRTPQSSLQRFCFNAEGEDEPDRRVPRVRVQN
jgi:hypothetical protein